MSEESTAQIEGTEQTTAEPAAENVEPTEAPPVTEAPAVEPQRTADMVPVTALMDERFKRQEAIEALKAREALDARREPVTADSLLDDPQKVFEGLRKDFETAQEKREAALRGEFAQQFRSLSESNARARHDDFQEKFDVFAQQMQKNPQLRGQLESHPDPAEFAYQTGKNVQLLGQHGGNLESFEEQIRADERKKLEAEAAQKAADSVPTSLGKVQGSAASTTGGPRSLREIFSRK